MNENKYNLHTLFVYVFSGTLSVFISACGGGTTGASNNNILSEYKTAPEMSAKPRGQYLDQNGNFDTKKYNEVQNNYLKSLEGK